MVDFIVHVLGFDVYFLLGLKFLIVLWTHFSLFLTLVFTVVVSVD